LAHILVKLECGPMPNVMAALPKTGGALCDQYIFRVVYNSRET